MFKLFKILISSSKKSFLFISFIIFSSLFSFIFTGSLLRSVENYLENSTKDFLGADIVINNKENTLKDTEKYILNKYKSQTSKKVSFGTSIFKDNNPDLYTINYIESNYPFYGSFEKNIVNKTGELIVNKKVYDTFGNTDIEILGKKYKIGSYLENDFLADFNPFGGNNIYLPYENLKNDLVSKISRVDYSLLVKTQDLEALKKDKKLERFDLNTEETSNNSLNGIIDRLSIFIQVFYQVIILLAFFIVTVSLNSYFIKITKDLKIMNILGLSNNIIIGYLFIIFLVVSIFASYISYIFVDILFGTIGQNISILSADINLLYKSIFISFLIISSGSFLNLINLKARSINNVSTTNIYKKNKKYIFSYFIFLFLILFIISLFAGVSLLYSLLISIGFILCVIFLIAFFYVFINFLYKISKNKLKKDFYLFDAIRSSIKPGNLSVIVILSSFISISGFLIFSTFSNGFISFLESNTKGQIDTFVINIDNEDIKTIDKYFNKSDYYEIIRSRILEINDTNLKEYLGKSKVSERFSREFNTTTMSLDNLIIKGKKLSSGEVGIDDEFSKTLGVNIGDTITFSILGIKKKLLVSQIRTSIRDGIKPFFYFNFYENDFKGFSSNYFLSYNSKEKGKNFNLELSKELGDQVSFINIGSILEKIKLISNYILNFVYTILAYIAIFSIITFIISLNFLKSFKKIKIKIYNTFGGNINKLNLGIFYEYSYLIMIGLVVSIIFSLGISNILYGTNSFLNFKFIYFLSALKYVIIFIVFYIVSYFIIYKKK